MRLFVTPKILYIYNAPEILSDTLRFPDDGRDTSKYRGKTIIVVVYMILRYNNYLYVLIKMV